MGPDWSLLPGDMLQLISEKITSVDQYVYFRAVCQPWRLACTPHPLHLIPLFPWLILSLREKSPSISILSLYDFSKSKIQYIEFSNVNCKDVCGLSRGWIVLQKDKELSFINPITRETKSNCFPSFALPPTILGFARNEKTADPELSDEFDDPFILKVILSSSPSDKDCIAVAEFMNSEWELGFSRIGDACWTILKLREYGPDIQHMWDFVCRNNLVYVTNDIGCLTVYDLQDLSQKIIIDRLSCPLVCRYPLLVMGEGELDGVPLLVKKFAKSGQVYKCVGCEWRRVANIGNAVLLLSLSTTCEIISLGNIQLNGWEGNHLYYYDHEHNDEQYPFVNIKIKMQSIENDNVKEAPATLGLFSRDIVDGYLSWFTPSLY